MTEKPRAILFDWDNTLIDSWAVIHDALAVTLKTMGHEPWPLEETKRRVRHSLRDAFPALFGDRWQAARALYLDTFAATHLTRLAPMAGAEEMLVYLAERGYYLAVVSNKTGVLLRREAAHLGWTRYFARLIGAGDASADKPDPAPIYAALCDSGIAPQSAWYVGDTDLDIDCALGSGCVPVLLGAGEVIRELSKTPIPLHFLNCAAFLAEVRGL